VAVENGLEELLLGTLLDIALYRSARGEKGRALEILAVLLHMPGGLEGVEDEAERIAFELESELKPEVVESVWEKGKSVTLDDFIQQILRDRRAPQ
jgi:hypothetical protein